jgi:hypothetical protein
MSPLLFYGLLVAFLVVIELGRPAVGALQKDAGVKPIAGRRRLVIDLLWYAPLAAVVVADLLGSELASFLAGVYFVIAAAGAALSALTVLDWLWRKHRARPDG